MWRVERLASRANSRRSIMVVILCVEGEEIYERIEGRRRKRVADIH
jgi:hypothetical protein